MHEFNLWTYLWWPAALILVVGGLAFDAYVIDKLEDLDRIMPRGHLPRTSHFASVARTIGVWWPVQLAPLVAADLLMLWLAPLWISATATVITAAWAYLLLYGIKWKLNSTTVFRTEPRNRLHSLALYSAIGKLVFCGILVVWGVATPILHLANAGAQFGKALQGGLGALTGGVWKQF